VRHKRTSVPFSPLSCLKYFSRAARLQHDSAHQVTRMYPSNAPGVPSLVNVNVSDESDDSAKTVVECRICKCGPEEGKLVRPCQCRGSCQYVHVACLQRWLQFRPGGPSLELSTDSAALARRQCEVCQSPYTVRITHRSRFDPQRCCSARSCETYFECVSLLVTLTMLIVTPWLVWKASTALVRFVHAASAPSYHNPVPTLIHARVTIVFTPRSLWGFAPARLHASWPPVCPACKPAPHSALDYLLRIRIPSTPPSL
jgi:hypothetical protein